MSKQVKLPTPFWFVKISNKQFLNTKVAGLAYLFDSF
jgi:hypothetical protein